MKKLNVAPTYKRERTLHNVPIKATWRHTLFLRLTRHRRSYHKRQVPYATWSNRFSTIKLVRKIKMPIQIVVRYNDSRHDNRSEEHTSELQSLPPRRSSDLASSTLRHMVKPIFHDQARQENKNADSNSSPIQ